MVRELTKTFETVNQATLGDLARHYAEDEAPRGEIVIVIGPAPAKDVSQEDVDVALRTALATQRTKDAAAEVARAFDLPKRDVYQRALALRNDDA